MWLVCGLTSHVDKEHFGFGVKYKRSTFAFRKCLNITPFHSFKLQYTRMCLNVKYFYLTSKTKKSIWNKHIAFFLIIPKKKKCAPKLNRNHDPRSEACTEPWTELYCSYNANCSINQMYYLLSSVFGDLPLVIDITFVSQDHPLHICWSMLGGGKITLLNELYGYLEINGIKCKGDKSEQTHIEAIITEKHCTSSIFRIQFLMLSKDFSLVMS